MRYAKPFACLVLLVALAGCSTPEERAADAQKEASEAEADIARQRLKLIDQYQDCVKEAAGDTQKATACESYLKAAEALQ
jgi:hypothetical protein